MKKSIKNVIGRGIIGFPIGISIGFLMTIIVSVFINDGSFYYASSELITKVGNELNAVILQTILSGIIGVGFSIASIIWEIDSWSIAKQSGIYFSIACIILFPIAYLTNWMQHSMSGILFD